MIRSSLRFRGFRCVLTCVAAAALLSACNGGPKGPRDPHIVPNQRDYEENRNFISPPTLGHPIYACSSNVTISNFLKDATLNVFIDGSPAPNPSVVGKFPDLGVNFDVGTTFTAGQVVHVTQTVGAVTSGPSNSVPVTSHTEDYPAGLPKPRLFKHPLRQCGHAVLVEDVVPGSTVEVFAENPTGGGAFGAPATVGGFHASTNWGLNWTGVSPQFELGARVSARAQLCTDLSQPSDYEITEPAPSPMPAGSVEPPVIEGQELVTIWGAGGPGDPPQHGPILKVYRPGSVVVGTTASPGGAPHTMGISPPATAGVPHTATQTLCVESNPADSRPTPTLPCNEMPAPKIKPPLPGDTQIYVTEHIPGAEILVFAGAEEIGHSSGSVINLSRPLVNGEIVKVMQRLGTCVSPFRYQIVVACARGDDPRACSGEWPAFRHNVLRNAQQVNASPLADPYAVKTLEVKWNRWSEDGGGFTASPVVHNGKLYVGTSAGRLYAYNATLGGAPLWQYPPAGEPALTTQWASPPPGTPAPCANPSSGGIASSVAMARIEDRDVVILAAPDQGRPSDPGGKFGAGFGSGRLFALDAQTGALIWATRQEVARMTGLTSGSTSELHEQIGYSSPLVLGGRIYVGVADHCDNPIQNGRVVAVELNTGDVVPDSTFKFEATSDRGGGVWTFVSGGLGGGLVTTTGNTWFGASTSGFNHGLSMVRLNPATGALEGKLQPVPSVLDHDPDWSAGATLMAASCGNLSLSTMKDGWSYAGNLGPPLSFLWQFPHVSYPFPTNDPNDHGDIRYHRAGAGWNDVYITMTGGIDVVAKDLPHDIFTGYRHLHALHVCGGGANRVRWIADLRPYTNEPPPEPVKDPGETDEQFEQELRDYYNTVRHYWGLGPPTVTRGIVYVGTNAGWLLAIADPSVWPALGSRCTWANLDGVACTDAGFQMVPKPAILKAMDLGSGSLQRNEPVIADGSLYVTTTSGRLFRVAPE